MEDLPAARAAFLAELTAARLLVPLGVPGVYARGGVFEDIVERLQRRVSQAGGGEADETLFFPPVFAREHYAATNHIHNFPDLLGSVHAFTGKEREHAELVRRFAAHEDWSAELAPSAVMLVPAACYPLYPASAGELPDAGRTVQLESWVYRHEPSGDPARMMTFRQREYVRLGSAEQAVAHRDAWLARARSIFEELGLAVRVEIANDPFFGRGGRLAKATQREQVLKWELLVPITSQEHPTAIGSCNYHLDYFGQTFGIRQPDGRPAHTACVGFGLERVALALFRTHGLDVAGWSPPVRGALGLA